MWLGLSKAAGSMGLPETGSGSLGQIGSCSSVLAARLGVELLQVGLPKKSAGANEQGHLIQSRSSQGAARAA